MYRVWLLIGIYGLNIFNLAGQEVEQGYLAAVRAAESFGPDDLRLAKAWNNLGTFYQGRGRYDEAEALEGVRSDCMRCKGTGDAADRSDAESQYRRQC